MRVGGLSWIVCRSALAFEVRLADVGRPLPPKGHRAAPRAATASPQTGIDGQPRIFSTMRPQLDYDDRSLFPRQVFFPMAGDTEGWARLAKSLRAEIDEGAIEKYRGTASLPFAGKPGQKVAVKVVDDRGIESVRILELE
jgi:adenine-specific DNA-methyltransferase